MSRTVDLPVGEHPGWELHDKLLNLDGSGLLSVAERFGFNRLDDALLAHISIQSRLAANVEAV